MSSLSNGKWLLLAACDGSRNGSDNQVVHAVASMTTGNVIEVATMTSDDSE